MYDTKTQLFVSVPSNSDIYCSCPLGVTEYNSQVYAFPMCDKSDPFRLAASGLRADEAYSKSPSLPSCHCQLLKERGHSWGRKHKFGSRVSTTIRNQLSNKESSPHVVR